MSSRLTETKDLVIVDGKTYAVPLKQDRTPQEIRNEAKQKERCARLLLEFFQLHGAEVLGKNKE